VRNRRASSYQVVWHLAWSPVGLRVMVLSARPCGLRFVGARAAWAARRGTSSPGFHSISSPRRCCGQYEAEGGGGTTAPRAAPRRPRRGLANVRSRASLFGGFPGHLSALELEAVEQRYHSPSPPRGRQRRPRGTLGRTRGNGVPHEDARRRGSWRRRRVERSGCENLLRGVGGGSGDRYLRPELAVGPDRAPANTTRSAVAAVDSAGFSESLVEAPTKHSAFRSREIGTRPASHHSCAEQGDT